MLARLHIAARDTGRRLVLALHAFAFLSFDALSSDAACRLESLAQITDYPLSGECVLNLLKQKAET